MIDVLLWLFVCVGTCYVISEGYTLAEDWDFDKQAQKDADEYLEVLLEESAEAWKSNPRPEARDRLYQFDKLEATVKRPEQSWALIPHAQNLVQYLGHED